MTISLTVTEWLAAKVGVLDEIDLVEALREKDGSRVYYECPCKSGEHYACRVFIEGGVSGFLSPVLNCYETRQQWAVRPVDVQALVLEEEEKFLALLKCAETLVPKILRRRGYSPETLFFLKDTHGVPGDVVETIWDSMPGPKCSHGVLMREFCQGCENVRAAAPGGKEPK